MDNVTYYSDGSVAAILIAPHAVFSAIATIFVGLRIYTARFITKNGWSVDEYVSIAALVANHLMLISECISVSQGLGSNMIKVTTDYSISNFLKSILGVECAYGIACPLSKSSVLAMYYRIFSSSRLLRYSTYIITAMLAGWGISVVTVSVFSCNPVHGFWDKTIPSKCIDSSKFYIGITVPNIIFDILTVALPVREIWKLQMGRDKKWAITSIFLLGGSVVLASVARLILFFIYLPGSGPTGNNISQTVIFPHAASAIETCLAIIAACLPPCAPLLKRLLNLVVTTVASHSGKTEDKKPNTFGTLVTIGKVSNLAVISSKKRSDDDDFEGYFERLDDNGSLQGSMDGLYTGGRSSRMHSMKPTRTEIHVQREVQVETTEDDRYPSKHTSGIPLRDL